MKINHIYISKQKLTEDSEFDEARDKAYDAKVKENTDISL